jgi:hypothetical protein
MNQNDNGEQWLCYLMPVIRIAMRYACVLEIPKEIKCQLSFAIHTHEIAITSHPKEALPSH